MWRAVLFALMLSLSLGSALAADTRDPYRHFFDDTWNDFSEELENAREQGKQGIFVFFEMDECPFCHFMKDQVLSRPEVQEYFKEHFLSFPVDIEGDIEVTNFDGQVMPQREFAFREHRVRATPVLVFFDLEGNMVHRFTGRTADADEFLLMGRFVAEKKYEEMRFTRYRREQQ